MTLDFGFIVWVDPSALQEPRGFHRCKNCQWPCPKGAGNRYVLEVWKWTEIWFMTPIDGNSVCMKNAKKIVIGQIYEIIVITEF